MNENYIEDKVIKFQSVENIDVIDVDNLIVDWHDEKFKVIIQDIISEIKTVSADAVISLLAQGIETGQIPHYKEIRQVIENAEVES